MSGEGRSETARERTLRCLREDVKPHNADTPCRVHPDPHELLYELLADWSDDDGSPS